MGLDEVKKQVMVLHQAVMMLELQYRLEAIDFLNDCCNDLRLKTMTYGGDLGGDQVLNLTMYHKEDMPFAHNFESEERFDDFRVTSFCDPHAFQSDPHHYDYANMEYEPPHELKLLDGHLENEEADFWEAKSDTQSEANPVNLVLPEKEEKPAVSFKKSRRKQMFTRKSVRRLAGKSVSGNDTKTPVKDKKLKKAPPEKIKEVTISPLETGPMSCRQCRTHLENLLEFNRHKDEKKCRAKISFTCPQCGVKFKFVTHLLRHLAGHKENNCKHCPKKMSSRSQYRDHLKQDHPEVKIETDLIPCKFCPMSFSRLHRLYSHYQLHHSKGKFVCTSCGLFLPTKEKHKEHIAIHDVEKKWKCELCGNKFYSKNTLTNHLKLHDSGKYRCVTCEVSVASKSELLMHKRKKHEVMGLDPKFECDHCHKQFAKKSILERHLSIHSDKKNFSCSHCKKMFGTLDALAKHKKRKTHYNKANIVVPESKYEKVYEDKLVCESCGKQYKTFAQLKAHLLIHKSTYKCDRCNATFNMKINLSRHLKGHDNPKSAVCELCGDSFSRLDGLREHKKTKHSEERTATCTVCLKAFKRKSELNRHMRIHQADRPYVCFCGRSYKQSAHLKSHQRSAHNKVETDTPVETPPREEKSYTSEHGTLLTLGTFDDHDYRLQDTFKVPYVPEDYGEHIGYGDIQFESQPSVSPAVDLSMVNITDVANVPESKNETEPSAMPLVNLSERVVQEYLQNLP